MLAAGAGSRFSDKGYALPKPLIEVNGMAMAIRAALSLPRMSEQRFVVRGDLSEKGVLAATIREAFPSASIVEVPQLTDGQARSCLLGLEGITEETPVLVGACDNGVVYNEAQLLALLNTDSVDAVVWVKRGYKPAEERPNSFGWVDVSGDVVRRVSCKTPLGDPKCDPVIIGTFYFRRTGDLRSAIRGLIDSGNRVNGEFYLDTALQTAVEQGMKVKPFFVDEYLCWGTPEELESYQASLPLTEARR